MGFGSIIGRAIIGGAMQVAAEVAREKERMGGGDEGSKPSQEVNSFAANNIDLAPMASSFRKALRVVGIIDGILEQTRDEWLTVFRASFGEGFPISEKAQQTINNSINQLAAHLRNKGFPYDTDVTFWATVSDIHLELMLHKAFSRAWEEWDENLDNLLERAAGEAKRIIGQRRMETLTKLMPDGRPPSDDSVFIERLMRAANELMAQVILPEIAHAGLVVENNPVFAARFGSLVPKVFIRDMIEFSRQLTNSG
jgi:hypothetical protein